MDTSRPLNINELETTSYRKITEAALKYLAGERVTNTHADGLESDSVEWNDAKSTDSLVTEHKRYSGDITCDVSSVDICALKDNPFVSNNLPSFSTLQFARDFKQRYGYHTSANGIVNSSVGGAYTSNYGVACMQPSGTPDGMLGFASNTSISWKCAELTSIPGVDVTGVFNAGAGATAAATGGSGSGDVFAGVANPGVDPLYGHGFPTAHVYSQQQSQGHGLNLPRFGAAQSPPFSPCTHFGDVNLSTSTLLGNADDTLPNLSFSNDVLTASVTSCDANCPFGSCAVSNGPATARVASSDYFLQTPTLGTCTRCCSCIPDIQKAQNDYEDEEAALNAIEMLSRTIDEKLTLVEERLSSVKNDVGTDTHHLANNHSLDASSGPKTNFTCNCKCHNHKCKCNNATPRVEPLNVLLEQQSLLASSKSLPLIRLHEQQDVHLSFGKACDLDLRDSNSDFNFAAMQGSFEGNASSDASDNESSSDGGVANTEDVTCTTYVSNLNLADVGIDDLDKLESFEPGDNVTSTPDVIFSPSREDLDERGSIRGGSRRGGGGRKRQGNKKVAVEEIGMSFRGNPAAGFGEDAGADVLGVAAGLGQEPGAGILGKESNYSASDQDSYSDDSDVDSCKKPDSESDFPRYNHIGDHRQGPPPTTSAAAARVASLDYGKIEQSWIIMMRCNEWLAKKCQRLKSMQSMHHMSTMSNVQNNDLDEY